MPRVEQAAAHRSGMPAADLPATTALANLHRAANAVRQHLEQAVLRREKLNWTAFVVLRLVWGQGRVETRHAAAHLGIAKGTLTGVVDGLVARDLVRRLGHPQDRRLVLLELTATGRRMMRRVLPAALAEESFALERLTAGQADQLSNHLNRLVEHLDGDEARKHRR